MQQPTVMRVTSEALTPEFFKSRDYYDTHPDAYDKSSTLVHSLPGYSNVDWTKRVKQKSVEARVTKPILVKSSLAKPTVAALSAGNPSLVSASVREVLGNNHLKP